MRESARAAVLGGRRCPRAPGRCRSACSTSMPWRGRCRRASRLVAVMTANNETGVVQPLHDVVDATRRRAPDAYVFTDAVQAAPYLDLAELAADADMVSLSAHKVGGPVGAGALGREPAGGCSRRASTAAGRSASAAAGPRTWRVRSGWRPRCAWWRTNAPPRHHGWPPCGTGSARVCWRPCPGRTAPCRPASRSCRGTCTCACRVSSGKRCWWPSAPKGCVSPADRPAPAGPSSPATCWPPWAQPPSWPPAPSASRWVTARTDADVDRALGVVPAVIGALRRRA